LSDAARRRPLVSRHGVPDTEETRSLWLVPVDGSAPVKLAIDLPIADLAAAVHPDGRHIAFVSGGSRTPEIRRLEGLLATRRTRPGGARDLRHLT
jgi:hypothetical protein